MSDVTPEAPRAHAAALAPPGSWPAAAQAPAPPVPSRGSVLISRIGWLSFLLPAVAVLVTAAILTPQPEGHGTHTQLGLPPCGFYLFTGIKCPGCGLTTCFAYMMEADVVGAAIANPFGIVLWMTTVAMVPIALIGLWRGLPVVDTLDRLRADRWAILLAVSSLLVFAVRAVATLL